MKTGGVILKFIPMALTLTITTVALAQTPPRTTDVLQSDLTGMPNQEALIQRIEFAPGTTLQWHTHPDGHEIVYLLEGKWSMEADGQPVKVLKIGEANYVAPNVVHRAMNDAEGPTKIIVIRIKPKDKPVTSPFKR